MSEDVDHSWIIKSDEFELKYYEARADLVLLEAMKVYKPDDEVSQD